MARPEFDIRIDANGKLTVKVSGVGGEECLKLSDMIAEIVGVEESRTLTSEYFSGPGGVRIVADTHERASVNKPGRQG